MTYIIVKGSGYDARKRVVRLQKDLINKVSRYSGVNKDKVNESLRDFNEMNTDSGLFNNESGRIFRGQDKVDITKNLDKPPSK